MSNEWKLVKDKREKVREGMRERERVCEREKEREFVCVWERERGREGVCVWERERETNREIEREGIWFLVDGLDSQFIEIRTWFQVCWNLLIHRFSTFESLFVSNHSQFVEFSFSWISICWIPFPGCSIWFQV